MTTEQILRNLQASLDDPMWADHAEISKATLREAIDYIKSGVEPEGNTGNIIIDRLIRRLMSSDPDFEDCLDAAVLIRREIQGPEGFDTWREAAVAERVKRVLYAAVLRKSRDTFAHYAALHRAKGTADSDKKAQVNEALVAEINTALGE